MENISLIEKIMLEAKQVGVLYHFTGFNKFISITSSDSLETSGIHKIDGKEFISMTRDKTFGFRKNFLASYSNQIKITIDGDKLSEHYKIRPYNDFKDNMRSSRGGSKHLIEFEEAVLTKKILNFSNYVIKTEIILKKIIKSSMDIKSLADLNERIYFSIPESTIKKYNIKIIE